MRKLAEPPLTGLGVIADHFPYTGCFEDDNSFLSDISFYDYGNDSSENELDDHINTPLEKMVDKFSKIQSFQRSKSGAGLLLEQNVYREPCYLRQKKPTDTSSSLDDSECEVTMQKIRKFIRTAPKKRETGPSCVGFDSGCRGENTRDPGMKDSLSRSLIKRKSDACVRGTLVQASQRRKKLCKAADLKSTDGREPLRKHKRLLDIKGKPRERGELKAKNTAAVEGMHVNGSDDEFSDFKASPKSSSRKTSVHGMDFTLREKTKLEIDEGSREGTVVRKWLLNARHATNHRDLKHTGSSNGQQDRSSQHLMPSVVRSMKKVNQEINRFCITTEAVRVAADNQRHAVDKAYDHGIAGEEVSSGVTEGTEGNKEQVLTEYGNSKTTVASTNFGWVMCDSCKKWRCIPASLIDVIESTNCGWFCKDNPDKSFADCFVPQEKTNREINRELSLSEVSVCEEGDEESPAIDSKLSNGMEQQCHLSTWMLIKQNIYYHRSRKSETLDEQMVCTCKPPGDGSLGCGDDCHNRMLNIECVAQTCPCGDACSNQQFQRRLYKRVKWFRCGRKGFGLQVLEDISKGAFIIEYVGEVLDMTAYEARQNQYALEGQKHFYFMQLSGSEVIDACYKGNLGRFINHSCDPNCTTEKWMVNGEICIGLFARKDLRKGEELTFDYKFVRLCGAAAKKCLCGSQGCRGFIGRDPTTPQSVVPNDSDEDDPEPIMIEECSENGSQIDDNKSSTPVNWAVSMEADSLTPDQQTKERNWVHSEGSERQRKSFKQVKFKDSSKTSDLASAEKLSTEIDGEHLEGLEEKLNKLVDEKGGLCKGQHEVVTRYLKLLVLTVFSSSDASNGEGLRSTRDLSLVLDALLKTQSRAILLEVLSRNGFQIMHKIVKQSRMDYKKTPVIRKILKVIEFLAVKRVLTIDQINAEPARSGAESIKDAIFQLCRHADTEVQSMARHFDKKYIKKDTQKSCTRGQRPPSDLSKWRLFRSQNRQSSSGAIAASGDKHMGTHRSPKKGNQPLQDVLDTTLVGGLPQCFWPFTANNLPIGGSQESNSSGQCLRPQTETAAVDDFGLMHPGPPSFSAQVNASEDANRPIGIASGIPVEQFSVGSTMGFISQQGPICIGIPVSQFQGAIAPKLDIPYMSQTSGSANEGRHSSVSSNMDAQESQHTELGIESHKVLAGEEPKVTFGISHSEFFKQMHGIFGSAFHPWQLQVLMAPHAWGPFLSGDIRIKDLGFVNDHGTMHKQPNVYHTSERSSGIQSDQSLTAEYRPDTECPVRELSPPFQPPSSVQPFAHASQPISARPNCMSNHQPYLRSNPQERSKMPYQQQTKASCWKPYQQQQTKPNCWKPQKWNSSRLPRFLGSNKQRNTGFRRDFINKQRFNRHSFARQQASPPHCRANLEEDSFERQTEGDRKSFDGRESMKPDRERALDGSYTTWFQGSESPGGTVPLERPWGYNQGNASNYSEEFVQDRAIDTSNSWSAYN